MTSQTEEIIQTQIRPICKPLSEKSIENIKILIEETRAVMSPREFEAHIQQWKVLAKKLNSNDKLTYLQQENCRLLLIELIKEDAMHLFNSSYLNRAKIDNEYIRYLKELRPYFFIEVIMVVSKLKTIHKHFYRKLSRSMCENHVTLKILSILELCNQKKRSVNNNKAKFLCIVEDQTDRLEITKQLGKMLREAWKKEKSKEPQEFQEAFYEIQEPIEEWKEVPVLEKVKSLVKIPSMLYQEEYNFDLSDQLMNFEQYPQHTYRYSDASEIFIE